MAALNEADLRERYDFDASQAKVTAAAEEAASGGEGLLRFLGRYVSWNAGFGAGVANLAAKIARSRHLFVDPSERLGAVADRSTHVASFFFDAARDEFDDGATPHRDSHRTLGQAVLKGIVQHYAISLDRAEECLSPPLWLLGLEDRTQVGYGLGAADDLPSIFRAMGFHLGSEVLADREFSIIDSALRRRSPRLVEALLRMKVRIADQEHPAYYWVGIHSGHGGGVEAEHFEAAIEGVKQGFRYTPERHHAYLRRQVLLGFEDFARCHDEFFLSCND